jgi:pyridoxamine 5'-phosphate oxidase
MIISRNSLSEEVGRIEKTYEGKDIPMPKSWGGYLLVPIKIEFWQGRSSRLHDRFLYQKINDEWRICQLAP